MKLREVRKYFDLVLSQPVEIARERLFNTLLPEEITEAHFCNEVLAHSTVLKYNADQWFDFLKKVPNKILLGDPQIRAKLTSNQIKKLDLVN
jgi:hypothetical protein